MRNLKRALSLALASVMLLGMMVVGTSAASYPDVDENDNVEAIEVLNAVKVMIGDRGNFRPDAAVNRHEMATIMAKLVLGVETADNYVGSHPFTDVFPWADKYVAACYENGLVSGTSATTFSGNQPLTAVQAAAMMLRALGYKDLSKGANDWRAPVTAMANQIRLFNGVASNPSEQLNRNQVAQLALNTLKSPVVNLKDNTISWTSGDGQIIMTGGDREYIVRSSNEAYARAINRTEIAGTSASQISGYTVELGEHLYNGKLQLRDTTDVFGRPARHWEYDGKVIGDYAKEELLVKDYVGKVTGKDLYDLLSSDVLDDYKLTVHVDGVDDHEIVDRVKADPNRNTSIVFDKVDLNRNNKAAVGATGTGVKTEVYVDHIEHEIYVAIINTYLAIADKDYDAKKEETALTIYGVDQETVSKEYVKNKGQKETYKMGIEEFAIVEDMAKNDSFLVTIADQSIQTIVPAEVISGATLSAFKLGDHVVSGGTDYNYTTTATYDAGSLDQYTGDGKENLKDRTYDIYLDAYGNLIGLKEIEAKKNYVFISGLDRNSSNLVNRIATANAIFLDGTSDTIQINMTKSDWNDKDYGNQNTQGEALLNTWCTYTKNGDIYTVKEVYSAGSSAVPTGVKAGTSQFHQTGTTTGREADKEFEINLKSLRLDGGGDNASGYRYVYGDSNSVYLTAEMGELRWNGGDGNYGIIKGAETVSTGIIDTSITVWNIAGAQDAAEENKVTGTIPADADHVAHGVYTLYNSDGLIIAAMAVGEGSAAKDLVYVHTSDLDLESDNGSSSRAANDGLWTWSRRVIRDGQEVTLTEVGDASEELEYMKQYHWYEVRTNGDGDVIMVEEASDALGTTGRDRFVTDYTQINDIVELDNVTTVLYQTAGGPNSRYDDGFGQTKNETLVVKGNNTLAVNTIEGSGIHFRNDVNVVLQYWNRNTKEIDIMAGEGVDDLKDMVSIVNDVTTNTDRYNDGVKKTYYVSALIENGLATDIVIFDSYNTYSVNRPVTPTGEADLEWDKTVEEWTLWVPAGTDVSNLTTSQISNWLAKAGCSEISKTRKGWDFIYGGMSYYEQIVNVKARNTTVTVTTDGNGTASVSDYAAKVGETVTVSYKADNGYELDYITVNGTEIAGNTFKMAVVPTSVYVAFKASAPVAGEVEDKAVWTGTNNEEGTYTLIDAETGKALTGKAKVGQTVVLNYYDALEITAGAKSAGNVTIEGKTVPAYEVTGNITVSNKAGWNWRFGTWLDSSWEETPPLAGAASMALRARSAVSGAGFLKTVREDKNAKFYIEITMADKSKVVVVVAQGTRGGVSFKPYKPASFDMEAAMNRTGISGAYQVWSEESDVNGDTSDTYTLTLKGWLAPNAEEGGNETAKVYTVDGNKTTEVKGTYGVDKDDLPVVRYTLPKNAKVQVQDDNYNANHFTIMTGTDQFKGYLITNPETGNETYVRVKRVTPNNIYSTGASLNFVMNDNLVLDLLQKDSFKNGEAKYQVAAYNGVVAKITDSAGKDYTLTDAKPVYVAPGAATIEIKSTGDGTCVGTGRYGAYNAGGLSVFDKDQTVSNFSIGVGGQDLDLYAGIKVTKNAHVGIKPQDWTGVNPLSNNSFVAVGETLDLWYIKVYPAIEDEVTDYFIADASSTKTTVSYADWAGVKGDKNVITDKEYTIAKKSDNITLWPAVEFTIDKNVEAKYTVGGKSYDVLGSEGTTWYMAAAVALNSGNSASRLVGLADLDFSPTNDAEDGNFVVVEPAKVGHWEEAGFKDYNYFNCVTNVYVTKSNVFNGAEFEAWTKVVAGDDTLGLVDEGYLIDAENHKVEALVFDNLYDIKVETKKIDAFSNFAHARELARMAKTIFVDPNWGKTITVYGSVTDAAKDCELKVEGAKKASDAVNDIFENMPGRRVCKDIVVGSEKVTLTVVEKAAAN